MAVQKRMAAQQQQQQTQTQQNVSDQTGQVVYNESIRDKTRQDLNAQADRDTKLAIAQSKNNK
jgi:hypothetical protein